MKFKLKLKFEFELLFILMLKEIIYNEIRFKDDEICVIRLLKIIKINDIEEIKRALKPKSSLLMINFNNDSKINCFKIRMKSM